MNIFQRWMTRGKVRQAAARVAKDPTVRNYSEWVQLLAAQGRMSEALSVAEEALSIHPRDAELRRLHERSLQMQREGRLRELQAELRETPRPALYRELVELLLQDGRAARAEELCATWISEQDSGEARYWRARSRAQRFFTDRRRDDGRCAIEQTREAEAALPGDERPLRLSLELHSRIGAWSEARRALARLLELHPGDVALEARFRSVNALAVNAPDAEQCLREVEKSGCFADEQLENKSSSSAHTGLAVRPVLQALARESGVKAAFFVRGSTALVQGPRGYTAERTARGVSEMLQSSRAVGRKLGLGQTLELRLEGSFGALAALPGESGSGVIWMESQALTKRLEDGLRELSGMAAARSQEDPS